MAPQIQYGRYYPPDGPNVLQAAQARIRAIYEQHDTVVVSFSGGKDSLAVVELCRQVAIEQLGCTDKITVWFRDEELIPLPVVRFLQEMRELPWIDMHWWAIPLQSVKSIMGRVIPYVQWDPARDPKQGGAGWMRDRPDFAILPEHLADWADPTVVLSQYDLNGLLADSLPGRGSVALLTGVRADESVRRAKSAYANGAAGENYWRGAPARLGRRKRLVTYARPVLDWRENDIFRYFYDQGVKYCLAGETRVLTRDGLRPIADLVNTTPTLLTTSGGGRRNGRWVEAEVRSFGVQPLRKITLRRNKMNKELFATGEHRWLIRDKRNADHRIERATGDLQPGDALAVCVPARVAKSNTFMSPVGVMAGFVYGDGHRDGRSSRVTLWGDKDLELKRFFDGHPTRHVTLPSGVTGVDVRQLPAYMKAPPPLDESPGYLYGWLAGYFAADGTVGKGGVPTICSASRTSIDLAAHVAALLGFATGSVSTRLRRGYGADPTALYTLAISGGEIPADFFLVDQHRHRYETEKRRNHARLGWTVVAVEETDRVEEVFCAVVPETHSFVLEDAILTGNCSLYDAQLWARMDLRVASMPTPAGARRFNQLAAADPESWDRLQAIFPDSADNARYLAALDDKATVTDNGVSLAAVEAWVRETQEGKTLENCLYLLRRQRERAEAGQRFYAPEGMMRAFMGGEQKYSSLSGAATLQPSTPARVRPGPGLVLRPGQAALAPLETLDA